MKMCTKTYVFGDFQAKMEAKREAMIYTLMHHAFVLPNIAASRVCRFILDTAHLRVLWWICMITYVRLYLHLFTTYYRYNLIYIRIHSYQRFDIRL